MKISFAPGRVSRGVRTESSFVQVCPEPVNVGDVEDQPPPRASGFALFEIEYEILPVFRAERREIRVFPAIDDLHTQKISVEPDGDLHASHPKGNCGNLLKRHLCHTQPADHGQKE